MSNTSTGGETPRVLNKIVRYVPQHERQAQIDPHLQKPQRLFYPIDRLACSGYMKMHSSYMVLKVQYVEPISFSKAMECK